MSSRTVLIATSPDGSYSYERPMFGVIGGVATLIGDLDTPTIVISDPVSGTTIRTMTSLAADDFWQPGTPVMVFGTLRVDVTGGGDTKHGSIRFQVET